MLVSFLLVVSLYNNVQKVGGGCACSKNSLCVMTTECIDLFYNILYCMRIGLLQEVSRASISCGKDHPYAWLLVLPPC